MGHGNGEMQVTGDIRAGKCWHQGLRHVKPTLGSHETLSSHWEGEPGREPDKKTGALCPVFLNRKPRI